MKIVLLENLGISKEKLARKVAGLEAAGHTFEAYERAATLEEQMAQSEGADALIVANMPVDPALIENNPNLKYIDVAFTGVDHIPLETAKAHGVAVSNASGYADDAVAELALALSIDLLRKLPVLEGRCRQCGTRNGIRGSLLKGKTVGIVGMGKIGQNTARLFKALGAHVIGYNRSEKASEWIDKQTDLDTLLKTADVVSLHLPLNKETRNLIGKDQIALMKPEAVLINTARGGIVDEKALADALNEGKIAGAAVDVFETEPPLLPENPLLKAQNCIVLPHIGFDSVESMEDRADIVFDNLQGWLAGNIPNRIV